MKLNQLLEPLAITMWDFSWLERRWSGAGYENWDTALDELVERGYNAVRIDAYPHLADRDPTAEHTILPCWNQQVWGSPAKNKVCVQPNLNTFIGKCRDRGIAVGLSTWFQLDSAQSWRYITSPERHAEIWKTTLDSISTAGLLDAILYVDLCNEWALERWAPFFGIQQSDQSFNSPASLDWMRRAISCLRKSYPDEAYTFSYTAPNQLKHDQKAIFESFDLMEPHIWMVQARQQFFYKLINYNYEAFDSKGYENVVMHAQKLYDSQPDFWDAVLREHIDLSIAESEVSDLPLITTECWGIVDYKDWPLLDWDWVKRATAEGVRYAASKNRWVAMATSNFCGPQFVGMWRDIDWHQEMTTLIRNARLPQHLSE